MPPNDCRYKFEIITQRFHTKQQILKKILS